MEELAGIRVGDRIWVLGWGGAEMVGTVTAVHEDVKNGEPGIDYRLTSGEEHPERWAYLSQVTDHRAA